MHRELLRDSRYQIRAGSQRILWRNAALAAAAAEWRCQGRDRRAIAQHSKLKKTTRPKRLPSTLQSPARQRPKMLRISEEMRRLAALLGQELASWPEVSMRPMFGM